MLREPINTGKVVEVRTNKATGRFEIVKLEERIAPDAPIKGSHSHSTGPVCAGNNGFC